MLGKYAHTFDVLVLGGGFAGVYCAKELGKYARRNPQFKVGLVAAENYMVFQPMLPEVAAASISPRHVINPIRQLCAGVDVFRGEVSRIETVSKTVHVNAGDYTPDVPIGYKQLVVALGARIDLSRVPGMTEHALLMQNVGDAMKLRSTIISRFEEANLVADRELQKRLLTFVVVGGGYSGVETAGEILDLMADMHRWYENIDQSDFEVVLIHSQDHLLPTLNRKLGEFARAKLEERGVRMIMMSRVRSVTANHVTTSTGDVVFSHTVVSTIGNAPHPIVIDLAASLNCETERGRLKASQAGQLGEDTGVWAIGDCSAIPMENGETCPATAQFAMRQGTRVGKNIISLERGKSILPFKFAGLGELAAIGHHTAVGEVMGIRVSGFIAWFMWRTVYLSKLPGLQRKLKVAIDWTFDLFFSRDINLLSPQHSKLLREVHLEPDDVLFNPGEPAFSLYFVKEGSIEIRDGARLIKTVYAGDYFGERALLEDKVWRYRAMACRPSTLIALGAEEFHAIVAGSSALKRLFTRSAQAYLSHDDVAALKQQLPAATLKRSAEMIMNRSVDSLTPDMPIDVAAALFRSKRHGSYPVVNDDGKLLGSVKRDDLYDYLKSHGSRRDGLVKELPLNDLPTAGEETTGSELVDIILRSGRNKVLVTDGEGKLIGMVTVADLMDDGMRSSREQIAT